MACLNFTLYLDSTFPRNLWKNDIRSLTKLCQQFGGGHYSIEIVHLAKEPQRAFHDGVTNTPTILLEQASGGKQILGNFEETELFLKSLDNHALVPNPAASGSLLNLFSLLKPRTLGVSRT
ncbi:MAG: hypothetical protein ACXW3Z_04750 [Limisphaerales bacterium]